MVVSLVHTSLGSSYLIAHVLHDPPPPTRTASPEQIKDFVEVTPVGSLLLFITAVPNTKLCAGEEEDSGGHVL